MAETAFCTGCQKTRVKSEFYERPMRSRNGRDVSYDCKECRAKGRNRSEETWNARFKLHGTVCVACGIPKPLVAEGECSACLADRGLRVCRVCGELKVLLLEFYQKRAECKLCSTTPGTDREPPLKSLLTCRICRTKKSRDEMASRNTCKPCEIAGPRRKRDAFYRQTYGVSLDEVEKMETAQGGRCAICKKEPTGRRLGVDHNHQTGAVRALLCRACNVGIGYFADSPTLLREAAAYIEKHL